MKKLIGLVVVVLVLVLGSYYGTGLITERTLKKNVSIINQADGLYVDIERYDRGWFTSTASFKWRLQVPERVVKNQDGQSRIVPKQQYSMDMPLTIYHGPVMFSEAGVQFGLGYADTTLTLPQPFAKQFSAFFSKQSIEPKLNLSILINYLNRSRFRMALPAFTLIAKAGKNEFKWEGMISNTTLSSNLDQVDGDFLVHGIQVINDKTKAIIDKITTEYALHKTASGLYLGHLNFNLPSLVIEDQGKKIFELSKFEMDTSSDIKDGLFHSYFKTSLERMFQNGKTYGPGVFKISVKNLDAEVLAQINRQANNVQQASNQQRQQALFAVLPELPKLFSKGPLLEVSEASFVLPEGKIEANMRLSMPKTDAGNPFQMVQQAEGEGSLKVSTAVLKAILQMSVRQQLLKEPGMSDAIAGEMKKNQSTESSTAPVSDDATADANTVTSETLDEKVQRQVDEKLTSLVASGLLRPEGDAYVVDMKLDKGQLTVNGQPFNTRMLKF